MRIVFLLNGPDTHGIVRAGRVLAQALSVTETEAAINVDIIATESPVPDDSAVEDICTLAPDIVILLASSGTNILWGPPQSRGKTIAHFATQLTDRCKSRVVLYVHDIYGDTPLRSFLRSGRDALRALARGKLAPLFSFVKWRRPREATFFAPLKTTVDGFILSNLIEKRRLERHKLGLPIEIVPHFIETRDNLIDPAEAKARLGLDGKIVLGLLGYIVRRKDYDTAVRALARLPENYHIICMGGVSAESAEYFETLQALIKDLDLGARVTVTGYIDDQTLDTYMSATDLALCPFRNVSASGSLATWLASRTPIVASDLDLFKIYRDEFGDMIRLAEQGNPDSFAQAIETCIADRNRLLESQDHVITAHGLAASAKKMHASLDKFIGLPQT